MDELIPKTKSPKFGPKISNIFRTFKNGTENLKTQLRSSKHIDETVDEFIQKQYQMHKNSDYINSLVKSIKIMNLASEQLLFTLTPVVAKYNDKSYESHFLPSVIDEISEIDHIFVEPKFGVEYFYYNYHLYIPIPKDILSLESPRRFIEENWYLIYPELRNYAQLNLIKQFEPLYITSRVYGWEGAWLSYSVTVVDKGDFWSLPLVRTTYNGYQPFLGIKEGEFTLLENDKTQNSETRAQIALQEIKSRITQNENIELEQRESIGVAPNWITAHAISSNEKLGSPFNHYYEDFSSKIGSGSFNENLNSAEEVLSFMKKDTMGKPIYRFKDEEIRNCRIK